MNPASIGMKLPKQFLNQNNLTQQFSALTFNLNINVGLNMARKNKRSKKYRDNIDDFTHEEVYKSTYKRVQPRNEQQRLYHRYLNDWSKVILIALGPAGTGKTYLAVQEAVESFKAKNIERIVITRPAVSVDEKHGFLPGGLVEKMAPWIRPIVDIFREHWSPRQTEYFMKQEKIEIAPLAYMRGRTFKNCWIIADEMQNATPEQMKMLLTRIGDNSRLVVTGDLQQHDRGYEKNGLQEFVERYEKDPERYNLVNTVNFGQEHIERHPVVSQVLDIYK